MKYLGLVVFMHFKVKTIDGRKYLYLIKNEWKNGKVVQAMQKYIGTPDQVYELIKAGKPNTSRIRAEAS